MVAVPWPRRAWPYRFLLALSLLALPYGCAGYAMMASLQPARATQVATACLGVMALAAVCLVVSVVALYRVATRPAPDAKAAC